MGTIADDVAAFEADIEQHIARLNADKRWYGADLSLAEVDALGQNLNKTLGIVLMLYGHACCIEDSLISVDGAGRYLVRVRPYSSGEEEEYYGTTAGRALVRALLDTWRMTDEEVAHADKARQLDKAGVVALSTLFDVHRALIELRKTIECGAFDSAYGVAGDIDAILADNSLPAKRVALNEMIDLLAKVVT